MMKKNELIEAVKKHKELYDNKHINYMKTKLKNKIWCEIAEKLKFKNGEEAKYIWLKLRATYRDTRRRHKRSVKDGIDAGDLKLWKYQNQMSFLEPYMLIRPQERHDESESNDDSQPVPEQSGNVYVSMDIETDNNEELTTTKVDLSNEVITDDETISTDACEEHSIAIQSTEMCSPSISLNPSIDAKARNKFDSDIISILNRSIQVRENRAKQRDEERKKLLEEKRAMKDPLHNFFLSMYQSTKYMSSQNQHMIKSQIFKAVSDAEADIHFSTNGPTGSCRNLPHLLELHHEHLVKEEPPSDIFISSEQNSNAKFMDNFKSENEVQ